MHKRIRQNLIDSYQEHGGFMVHSCSTLKRIFDAFSIDPKTSTDRRILDIEGVTHFFQRGVLSMFRKLQITADDTVLSLGEGNGAPSRLLAKSIGCRITGVDINPDQVAKARECALLHGVEGLVDYVVCNVEELDLPHKEYSRAYCNETTCHWQYKQTAFSRIHAHCRKGARIGINEWLKGDRGSLNDAWKQIPEFRRFYKEDIWFQMDLEEYRELLETTGFSVVSTEECTDRVDARMRGRLKEVLMEANPYVTLMGPGAREMGKRYYSVMLETHYEFLRYGVIIAEKQ